MVWQTDKQVGSDTRQEFHCVRQTGPSCERLWLRVPPPLSENHLSSLLIVYPYWWLINKTASSSADWFPQTKRYIGNLWSCSAIYPSFLCVLPDLFFTSEQAAFYSQMRAFFFFKHSISLSSSHVFTLVLCSPGLWQHSFVLFFTLFYVSLFVGSWPSSNRPVFDFLECSHVAHFLFEWFSAEDERSFTVIIQLASLVQKQFLESNVLSKSILCTSLRTTCSWPHLFLQSSSLLSTFPREWSNKKGGEKRTNALVENRWDYLNTNYS